MGANTYFLHSDKFRGILETFLQSDHRNDKTAIYDVKSFQPPYNIGIKGTLYRKTCIA